MDKEALTKYVLNVLIEFLGISREKLEEAGSDGSLTGHPIWMSASDLAYLFLELEKRLEIQIPPEKIQNYEFNSVNGIVNCIFSCFN